MDTQPASPNTPQRGPTVGLSRAQAAAWALLVAVAVAGLGLFVAWWLLGASATRLRAEAAAAVATRTSQAAPNAELLQVQAALTVAADEAGQLTALDKALRASQPDWPRILAAVAAYDPARLRILSVAQQEAALRVQGLAANDDAVLVYVRQLETSGAFRRVSIESMRTAGQPFQSPTATPMIPLTATPTGGAIPTSTNTPAPGDIYEVDDFGPLQPMVVGQSQVHTFWPIYDRDTVRFLAKAGRYYSVAIDALADGVDTAIKVSVGGVVYGNDDRAPGQLSSEIIFQAPAFGDSDALVEIVNRGLFGPDKAYRVWVTERAATVTPTATGTVAVTASPTATMTPSPTPSATATHTHTPSPTTTLTPTTEPSMTPTPSRTPTATSTPGPSPTFDVRDPFEPDDVTPGPIALGVTQIHTFYPSGDVDRVFFTARAGHTYTVTTSSPAYGMDTSLIVYLGAAVYSNHLNPSGAPGSRVVLQNTTASDIGAVVEVINSGSYSPGAFYHLRVDGDGPTAGLHRAPGLAVAPRPADALHTPAHALESNAVEFILLLDLGEAKP